MERVEVYVCVFERASSFPEDLPFLAWTYLKDHDAAYGGAKVVGEVDRNEILWHDFFSLVPVVCFRWIVSCSLWNCGSSFFCPIVVEETENRQQRRIVLETLRTSRTFTSPTSVRSSRNRRTFGLSPVSTSFQYVQTEASFLE